VFSGYLKLFIIYAWSTWTYWIPDQKTFKQAVHELSGQKSLNPSEVQEEEEMEDMSYVKCKWIHGNTLGSLEGHRIVIIHIFETTLMVVLTTYRNLYCMQLYNVH